MPATDSVLTQEELARLGIEFFDRHVRPRLRPEDGGKFVAIDTAAGEFEIDDDDYSAVARLLASHPGADVWLMRADGTPAYRMRRAS